MDEKGQGAFEYILMLAGILLVVIVVILILRTQLSGVGGNINATSSGINKSSSCQLVQNSTTNCCWDTSSGVGKCLGT